MNFFTDVDVIRVAEICWRRSIVDYFVRSGNFNLANTAGVLRNAGQNGNWWSSRGADNVWGSAGLGGYNLEFNANGVRPSNGPHNRYLGFPLRCLSTVLDYVEMMFSKIILL